MIKHINKVKPFMSCRCSDECLILLSALSDKIRQKIIGVISTKKEMRVSNIAEKFTLSRPTISHHLNLMKQAKLLNSRKEGKEVYYFLNKKHVIKEMETIINSLKNCC